MNSQLEEDFLKDFFEKSLNQDVDPRDESELIQSIRDIKKRYLNDLPVDEGGMKKITSCTDSLSGRTIAIASMKSCKNAADIDNFIREARLTAMLEHPNIVPLYDINLDEEGYPYFSMKLLGGENLKSVIAKLEAREENYIKKFSLNHRLEIFLKITDAISYAHSKGIVHLDLKPANIHLNEFGEVLVCDWGLARELDTQGHCETLDLELDELELQKPSVQVSLDKRLKGTPGFMAPEQIKPSLGKRTEQSDVFSLGCLLYTLLTCKQAFDGGTLDDVLKNTLTGSFSAPNEVQPKIPTALNAIILKAMSTEQSQRYENVAALSADIRSWIGGFATQAEDASFFQQLLLIIKRHKTASLYSLLFLVFSSLIIVYSFDKINQEKLSAQRAEQAEKRSREIAENAQDDLTSTLNDLQLESVARKKISTQAAENFYKTAVDATRQNQFTRAMTLINDVLSLDPNHQEALLNRGLLNLGNLRFPEALKDFKSHSRKNELQSLINLAEHYSQFTKDNSKLSLEQIAALYKDIKKVEPRLTQNLKAMIVKAITNTYPLETKVEFAQYHIFQQNPHNNNFAWFKRENFYTLDISSNPGLQDISSLEKLPISELNLSRTKVRDISALKRVPLKKLDLSFTHVAELASLRSTALEEIRLTGSHVTRVNELKLKNLRVIYLNNFILNLKSLFDAKNLREIHLPNDYPDTPHIRHFDKILKVIRH